MATVHAPENGPWSITAPRVEPRSDVQVEPNQVRRPSTEWRFGTAAIAAPFQVFFIAMVLGIIAAALVAPLRFLPGWSSDIGAGIFLAGWVFMLTATIWGLPFYILFGLPLFAAALRVGAKRPLDIAGAAFLANILGAASFAAVLSLVGGPSEPAVLTLLLGGLVAPIWGYAFGRFIFKGDTK